MKKLTKSQKINLEGEYNCFIKIGAKYEVFAADGKLWEAVSTYEGLLLLLESDKDCLKRIFDRMIG